MASIQDLATWVQDASYHMTGAEIENVWCWLFKGTSITSLIEDQPHSLRRSGYEPGDLDSRVK